MSNTAHKHVTRAGPPKATNIGGVDRKVRSTSPPKINTASNGPRVTTTKGTR